jgi:hypothetical protein
MATRTAMFWVSGALACAACGGAPADPTGTSADSVKGSLAAGAAPDAGRGKERGDDGHGASCKPLDGGRSPCARGDGGEDDDMDTMDDDDGGDMDRGDDDAGHRRDGGRRD